MRIAIVGTGALASLFAVRLSDVAHVVMVGSWAAQIEEVQAHGLTLIDAHGHASNHKLAITQDPDSVAYVDVALVLVKSYQTQTAVSRIQPLLAPNGLIITLQNGIGNANILQSGIPAAAVTVGITSMGATMIKPGTVRHAGVGSIHLAAPAMIHDSFSLIVNLLRAAGFATEIADDVDSLVWGKLAINTGINPLTAVLNVPNGYLVENDTAKFIMMTAAKETESVAVAQGMKLPYPNAGERVLAVAQATAQNRSSMLQDLDRGSQTEVDAICGAVVNMGETIGVKTAVNKQLLAWVKQIESGKTISNLRMRVAGQIIDLSSKG